MDLFHAVVCNVEVTFGVEAHTIGLVVFPFSAGIFGEVCEDFHGADFPLCNHGKFENSVELAFADEKSFAVLSQDDTVGEGQTGSDEVCFAGRVDVVDCTDEVIFTRVTWIGEVETALWIEGQIVGASQWFSVAFA